MKKLNQFKVAFIELCHVKEMPFDSASCSRFPAGSLYVSAENVVYQNISDDYMLNLCRDIELNGSDIQSVVNFSWSKDDIGSEKALKVNKPKILRALREGIIIEGMDGVFSRFLRTPSQSRAGGAWLSNNPVHMREIISFGLENNYTTDFDVVPSKWDASLSLSCTTSNPVKFGRELRVQIIPDLEREVECAITTVERDEKAPNPLKDKATEGMVYEKLSDRRSKRIGNPDIRYKLTTKVRKMKSVLGDGNALGTFELFDIASVSLQASAIEAEHLTLLQFRGLPGCKGTITKFDIKAYCDEYNIEYLINIYGEKFDPREVDIIMFESCFKWANRFSSVEEYYNKTIRASYNVTRTHSEFYIRNKYASVQSIADVVCEIANGTSSKYDKLRIAYNRKRGSRKLKAVRVNLGKFSTYTEQVPYFKDNTVLRVANVTKVKDEYHKLTYQYLQSLLNLDINGLIPLTQPIYKAVANCTTDITVAKALFGMVHDESANKYSRTLVSKACELMELNQDTFRSKFVQNRILSTMNNLISDQKRGSVMAKGGYHFIAPEPAIFFYQKGIKKGKNGRYYVPTLKKATKVGLLKRGRTYLRGRRGKSLGFRSPLIHASEVAQLDFGSDKDGDSELDRWYGHLYGVILFNSYDTTAMRMGGADYDGDKIYLLDNNAPENQVIISNYQPDLPLIVSPLENLKAHQVCISKEEMLKVDERTLQNYTGEYTNMGTYYQNFKYHVNYRFDRLVKMLDQQNPSFWNEFLALMPKSAYVYNELSQLTYDQVRQFILTELVRVNEDCDYKVTMIRIAQAGEIDFTKHGTRFALPMEVETNRVPLWLKDYTLPENGITQEVVDYGIIEYSWLSEKGKKTLYKMDTPMQALCDDVTIYHSQAKLNIKENALTDVMSLFLGGNYIIPQSVKAIYDDVAFIAESFCNEVAHVTKTTKGRDIEYRTRAFIAVYNKYTEICKAFTDRKALAISGLFFEQMKDSKSSFAFICCYDGLIELLLEQPTVSPRIARISVPSWADTIYVNEEGKTGYIMDGSYKELSVSLPFVNSFCNLEVKDGKVNTVDTATACIYTTEVDLEDGVYAYNGKSFIVYNKKYIKLPTTLSVGSYAVKSYFGKTYIAFGHILSDKSKKELSDARYDNRTAQGRTVRNEDGDIISREHVVEIVASKRDKFQIVGMGRVEQPTNAVEVVELIKEYSGQCMVIEGLKDDGTTAPMVSIGGRIVGMIATKDNLKINKDYVVNYRQMYGHVFRLSISGASRRIDGTPLLSLEVLAEVITQKPLKSVINKVHSLCDLSKWYWNVDWKTFQDFGYTFKGVSFFADPEMDKEFATVALDCNGEDLFVIVSRTGAGLNISRMIYNNQLIDLAELPKDFDGVVYRAVSYLYAQSLME